MQVCEPDENLRPAARECFDAMRGLDDYNLRSKWVRFAPLLAPAELLERSMRHCTEALQGVYLESHCTQVMEPTAPVGVYFDGQKVHRGRARKHGLCVFLTLKEPRWPAYDVDDTTTAAVLFAQCLTPHTWCAMGPEAQRWAIAWKLRRLVEEAHQRGYGAGLAHELGNLTLVRRAAEAYEKYLSESKRGVVDEQVVARIVGELLPDPRPHIEANHRKMAGEWTHTVPGGSRTLRLDPTPFRRWRSWVIPAAFGGELNWLNQIVLAWERGAPTQSAGKARFRQLAFDDARYGTCYTQAYVNCWHQGIPTRSRGKSWLETDVHKWQKFSVATLGYKQLTSLLLYAKQSLAVGALRSVVRVVKEQVEAAAVLSLGWMPSARTELQACELDVFMQQAGPPSRASGPNYSVTVSRPHNDQDVKDALQEVSKPIQIAALVSLPRHSIVEVRQGGTQPLVGSTAVIQRAGGQTQATGYVVRTRPGAHDVAVFEEAGDARPTFLHVLGSGAPFAVGPKPGSMGIFMAPLEHESVSVDSAIPCLKLAIRFRFGKTSRHGGVVPDAKEDSPEP
jgi:hypothetical protein